MSSAEHENGPIDYSATICQSGLGGCGERRHVPVHMQLSPSPCGLRSHRREVSGGLSRLGRPSSGEDVLNPNQEQLLELERQRLGGPRRVRGQGGGGRDR